MLEQRLIIFILLGLSAFFSASELAIMSLPMYKIKQLANEGSKIGVMVLKLRINSERTLITILIGNNLVNVIISIYASKIGDSILQGFAIGGTYGLIITSLFITFLILFFGEILPKVISTKYSLRLATIFAPIVNIITYLLFPIVYFLEYIIFLINKLLVKKEEKVSRDDVEFFVEDGRKQGLFTNIESMIVKNLLDFNERSVESILRHRTELFALNDQIIFRDAIKKILDKPYSRIPIFHEDKDKIIGIFTIRDFLKLSLDKNNIEKKLCEFKVKPVFRIPLTANVLDVFLQMKKVGSHFAIVIDEHGGLSGIVTFEDILEDLVGDIKDESDINEENDIVLLSDNEYIITGTTLLRDVINLFNIENFQIPTHLEDEFTEEDTVSYIILAILKKFAKQGEIIDIGQLKFEIIETIPNQDKILKIRVKLI